MRHCIALNRDGLHWLWMHGLQHCGCPHLQPLCNEAPGKSWKCGNFDWTLIMPCIMPKPNYIHVINFIKGMQHMTVKAKTKRIIYSEVHIHREPKVSKPPLNIFSGLISWRTAVIVVHWYSQSILLSNQNVFMFSVSGSDRAIRDPIKPELWDLLFALQSSPNCPKTAGNTVCCTEVFKALQIVEIHIWRTKHKSSQKLTVPTYMRAGLETTQNTQNTQNTNTKYFIL